MQGMRGYQSKRPGAVAPAALWIVATSHSRPGTSKGFTG